MHSANQQLLQLVLEQHSHRCGVSGGLHQDQFLCWVSITQDVFLHFTPPVFNLARVRSYLELLALDVQTNHHDVGKPLLCVWCFYTSAHEKEARIIFFLTGSAQKRVEINWCNHNLVYYTLIMLIYMWRRLSEKMLVKITLIAALSVLLPTNSWLSNWVEVHLDLGSLQTQRPIKSCREELHLDLSSTVLG